jgi:hypothetical protein
VIDEQTGFFEGTEPVLVKAVIAGAITQPSSGPIIGVSSIETHVKVGPDERDRLLKRLFQQVV